MWTIDKSFSFCYGHRVFTQVLDSEYCEGGNDFCKCKAIHGHEGLVHVFLEGDELDRGFVVDFQHLGFLKDFIDTHIDHKFIIARHDPMFEHLVGGSLQLRSGIAGPDREVFVNNCNQEFSLIPAMIPNTDVIAGYSIDVGVLNDGPIKEVLGGFLIIDFVPTSEYLAQWMFQLVQAKMNRLNVKVSKITWNETPKSRAEYSE